MFTILLFAQVVIGLVIVALVLLQQGKGADMGAAFGAGASGTVFGAGGGGSFFSRATGVLAALFFANSILLSSPLVHDRDRTLVSVTESIPVPAATDEAADMPAADAAAEPEAMEQAPADLPDVPDAAPATESDLPE